MIQCIVTKVKVEIFHVCSDKVDTIGLGVYFSVVEVF